MKIVTLVFGAFLFVVPSIAFGASVSPDTVETGTDIITFTVESGERAILFKPDGTTINLLRCDGGGYDSISEGPCSDELTWNDFTNNVEVDGVWHIVALTNSFGVYEDTYAEAIASPDFINEQSITFGEEEEPPPEIPNEFNPTIEEEAPDGTDEFQTAWYFTGLMPRIALSILLPMGLIGLMYRGLRRI